MTKLDLKTKLFLYITKVSIKEHIKVETVTEKKKFDFINNCSINDVYVFENYTEYKNFFLMYFDDISDDLIKLAIYTRGKDGQVVAHRKLCEKIIVKKKIYEFYNSITKEQIDKIHDNGKLTPLEAIEEWDSHDLCMPSETGILSIGRCAFFDNKCDDCLMEYASHKLEHDSINNELKNNEDSFQKSKKFN